MININQFKNSFYFLLFIGILNISCNQKNEESKSVNSNSIIDSGFVSKENNSNAVTSNTQQLRNENPEQPKGDCLKISPYLEDILVGNNSDAKNLIVLYTQKIMNESNDFFNYQVRGFCKLKMHDWYGSKMDFESALALLKHENINGEKNLQIVQTYLYLNVLKLQLQDPIGALDYCIKADSIASTDINLNNFIPHCLVHRAIAYHFLKENEKCCLDLSNASNSGCEDAFSLMTEYCK